jgi:hypothetical protein
MGNFAAALAGLLNGVSVARALWSPGESITLQVPDSGSKMTLPYIYYSDGSGNLVPWVASHSDLLATDWDHV